MVSQAITLIGFFPLGPSLCLGDLDFASGGGGWVVVVVSEAWQAISVITQTRLAELHISAELSRPLG